MIFKVKNSHLTLVVASAAALFTTTPSVIADDQIRIVGSSTVYPFSTVVAERFGRTTDFKTPIVESTGTGGGFKLFCAGVGSATADVSNASRAIKDSEVKMCADNGVKNVIEVKVGYDGITLANALGAIQFDLSTRDIFLALAKKVPNKAGEMIENPYVNWSDVNSTLPNTKIEVLGPPPTSGTRDAFVELAMEGGCKTFSDIKALKKTNKNAYKTICHTMREDGVFIEAGENDNLIVQKLVANENALGIFGFSFLDQNSDKVKAAKVNGTAISFETISDGSYPISRPLFFYVKGEHVKSVPALKPFVEAFISAEAMGEDGYLTDRGLIPMGQVESDSYKKAIKAALK